VNTELQDLDMGSGCCSLQGEDADRCWWEAQQMYRELSVAYALPCRASNSSCKWFMEFRFRREKMYLCCACWEQKAAVQRVAWHDVAVYSQGEQRYIITLNQWFFFFMFMFRGTLFDSRKFFLNFYFLPLDSQNV
jgi:hypothetical protein